MEKFYKISRYVKIILLSTVIGITGSLASADVNLRKAILEIKEILSNNNNVNPCDDFFAYVCENRKISEISEENSMNQTELLKYHFYNGNHLSPAEIKARHFYESCKKPRNGTALMMTSLYQQFGGWPVLEPFWQPKQFHWIKAIELFKSHGIVLFIAEDTEEKNNKKILRIFPNLGHLLSSDVDWNNSVYQIMQQFGATEERTEDALKTVYPFAAKLHNIVYDALFEKPEETVEVSYKLFKEYFPEVSNWDSYFNNVVGLQMENNDRIYIKNKTSLKKILNLLSITKPETIANYLWIDFLRGATYNNCEELVEKYFQLVFSNFEDRPKYNERNILEMLENLENVFNKSMISNNNFVQLSDAEAVLDKWKKYTTYRDSNTEIEYQHLNIDSHNFIQNYINCVQYYSRSAVITGYDSLPSEDLWNFYNFLRYPLYDDAFPMSFNYAGFLQSATFFLVHEVGSYSIQRDVLECFRNQSHLETVKFSEDDEFVLDALNWILVSQISTQAALQAYKNRLHDSKIPRAKYKNLENEKLFFISYISSKCKQKYLKGLINSHLRNSDAFGVVFQCPVGSGMNPSYKCTL